MVKQSNDHAIIETRCKLYDWFSVSLDRPVEENFGKFYVDVLKEESAKYNLNLKTDIELIFESVENKDITYTDVLVDYSKLFIGPAALLAPPYESYYMDNGRVMGDSTMKVIEMYNESGLELSPDFKDLPDHIAVELNFMVFLCQKTLEAIEKGKTDDINMFLDKQKEFYNYHIINWVGILTGKIKENARTSFYSGIASALDKFIEKEADFLKA